MKKLLVIIAASALALSSVAFAQDDKKMDHVKKPAMKMATGHKHHKMMKRHHRMMKHHHKMAKHHMVKKAMKKGG